MVVKVVALGECMVELYHEDERTLKLGFAGDTFNMATYLARAKQVPIEVQYATAVGVDPYSVAMRDAFNAAGLQTEYVAELADRLPGLYLIKTDTAGERRFYFYRSQAAARYYCYSEPFNMLQQNLSDFQHIYFSGITLGIYDDASRERLFALLTKAKQLGLQTSFDLNYRKALWPNKETAVATVHHFLKTVHRVMTTFDDEATLFGDETPIDTITRLQKWGVQEIVVKCGAEPCWIWQGGEVLSQPACVVAKVIDTTAAGDSFNGAYLAARIAGLDVLTAAKQGHQMAAKVIQCRGAIVA